MMDASFFLCALDCIVKIDSRRFFKTLRRFNQNAEGFLLINKYFLT